MKLDANVQHQLNFVVEAREAVSTGIEHLPPLVIDQCLGGDIGKLAEYCKALTLQGHTVPTESLSIPRKDHSPRPVVVPSMFGRIVYNCLTSNVTRGVTPSRTPDNWKSFDDPTRYESDDYVVEIDVAACYEYIDHRILSDELTSLTLRPSLSASISGFLRECMGRGLGLPQLNESSDLLADVYLAIPERKLLRRGLTTLRYADDFRIVTKDWGEANEIVEYGAECLRLVGLVPSSGKTRIYRASTLLDQSKSRRVFLSRHLPSEADVQKFDEWADRGRYGYADKSSPAKTPPESIAALEPALRSLLEKWAGEVSSLSPAEATSSSLGYYISDILTILSESDQAISEEESS